MFKWLTGDIQAVIDDVNALRSLVATLVTDLAIAKTEVETLQSVVTKLSNGALTAATEIALLKAALAAAGVVVASKATQQCTPK